FNGGAALIACHRWGDEEIERLVTRAESGLALTDYAALERRPQLAAAFEPVVLVDPPRGGDGEMRAGGACGRGGGEGGGGGLWRGRRLPSRPLDRRGARVRRPGARRAVGDAGGGRGDLP